MKKSEASEAVIDTFTRATRRRDGYDDQVRPRFVEMFEVEDDD